MTDHIIPLAPSFRYVNQFASSTWAPTPSHDRCATASTAMLAEIAYPGRWIPEELEHDLYQQMAGPDVASDTNGIPPKPLLDWFAKVNIGVIDLSSRLSNLDDLRAEMEAMNKQGLPQLVEILDESKMKNARTGAPLYSWPSSGLVHYIVRVGYSDDSGYGLYFDPAAPGFQQPIPVSWADSLVPAGIYFACAIMPARTPPVGPPPAGFSYQTGVWPKPAPVFDAAKAESTVAAAIQALDAASGALANLKNDLDALKTEV